MTSERSTFLGLGRRTMSCRESMLHPRSVPAICACNHEHDVKTKAREIRDVLQTEIRNFDGNGPRPGERCETKWRIFAKIHLNVG